MGEISIERYDKRTQHVLLDGRIVAKVLRLANGYWGVYDCTESCRLLPLSYISPKSALSALKRTYPPKGPDHE